MVVRQLKADTLKTPKEFLSIFSPSFWTLFSFGKNRQEIEGEFPLGEIILLEKLESKVLGVEFDGSDGIFNAKHGLLPLEVGFDLLDHIYIYIIL